LTQFYKIINSSWGTSTEDFSPKNLTTTNFFLIMTINQSTYTISSTDEKEHGKKEKIFSFTCNSNYQIKDKDLIDLFITVGQGITYWGEAYINFRPNKAYEKGFLKIEREGGIFININKLDLDSKIFCVDRGDDTDIEIIDTKTVKDFIETIKSIIESPNSNSEIKSNLIEGLATSDFGLLDAGDMDYIFQKCIFGSCVYG
tara:strand:+ start:706 stop:1308 length:603 start_codon:yes stop_codon:yes gene_type:complete